MADITTQQGRSAWRAGVEDPANTLVCSDFDGVLSPIVKNPDAAWASEAAVSALARLGQLVGRVAIVTGRTARKAVELGRLEHRPGLEHLTVLGLYGFERWDAATGEYDEPPAPAGVEAAWKELPGLLDRLGLAAARLENKRMSISVHTRELPDSAAALGVLAEPLGDLALRHGLRLEPGRHVFELRAAGRDKGDAVRGLVEESSPRVVMYAGDDLGDLPAYEAVREMRYAGRAQGLLVCSSSDEQDALVALADVVVDGPDGVAALFDEWADLIGR